jgi:hypothetical protein
VSSPPGSARHRPCAAGDNDWAIGAADDIARDASAETPAPRAEHHQPRAADAGELDHALGGAPGELLAGGGHARSVGDCEGIVQRAPPGAHFGVEATLVVRLAERGGRLRRT